MAYEAQTREQILEAELELLRYRLDELLGTALLCPIQSMRGAQFRIMNLLSRRSPMTVPYGALHHAMNEAPEALNNPHCALKVHVSRARSALADYEIEIETIWGIGYRLPPESKTKWDALVAATNSSQEAAA